MKNSQYRNYEKVAQSIAYIRENFKQQPDLAAIAAHIHLSPYHFQRLFTQWAGVSPKKFLQYTTLAHAKSLLTTKAQTTLLETSDTLGLSSSSRLHDLFVHIESMTPAEYKNGGENLSINYHFTETPFGKVLIANTQKGICHIHFNTTNTSITSLYKRFPNALIKQKENNWQKLVANCFQPTTTDSKKIKLHLKGTPFQLKVWEALLSIPMGQLKSYNHIAHMIGKPTANRAVGTAIGNNPVAFLIPCHRVIKSNGMLSKYRWGVERKLAMIAWETIQKTHQNNQE